MATVMNPGDVGRGIDLAIGPKSNNNAFRFNGLPATKVAVTTTSQPVALNRTYGGDNVIRCYNTGTAPVRLKFGRDNTVVATSADKAVAPGSIELFSIGVSVGWVAVLGDAAGTIEFDCGSGV